MSNQNTAQKTSVKALVILSLLTAIEVVMAFTPLGYLRVGLVSISFLTIPVVIGAIILGASGGVILGGVFGITSFIQCFGIDPFGTMLLGINPFFTFVTCVGTRILMGLFVGLIFKWLHHFDKTKLASYGVASLCGALLNTILFMGAVIIFFWNSEIFKAEMMNSGIEVGKGILGFFIAIVGTNGLIEACVTLVVGGAIAKVIPKSFKNL